VLYTDLSADPWVSVRRGEERKREEKERESG
jgi:hypothetical protein